MPTTSVAMQGDRIPLDKARYSSAAVVNWILSKAFSTNSIIDHMKLQKLVYFSHGWFLVKYNAPLIDEFIEAWRYGPVVPTVYHEYKKFGNSFIPNSKYSWMPELGVNNGKTVFVYKIIPPKDTNTVTLLDDIWSKYSQFNAKTLSDMTHKNHTLNPWKHYWEMAERSNMRSMDIPNDKIREYFYILHESNQLS